MLTAATSLTNWFRACLMLVATMATPAWSADATGRHYDLRLPGALVGGNAKTWMRQAHLSFTVVDGKPRRARLGPPRGWTIAGWSGTVDHIELTTHDGGWRATVDTHVSSNGVSTGRYTFTLNFNEADRQVTGAYEATLNGKPASKGPVRGLAFDVPWRMIDPADALYTVQLVGVLPRGEVMTLYLDHQADGFAPAFAFAPSFTRRPLDVDASGLSVKNGRLIGRVHVTRINRGQPDGGERSVFGTYELDARIGPDRVLGEFKGATIDGAQVAGPAWGESTYRPALPARLACSVKLENGLNGGADWQNRAFFRFNLMGGQAKGGKFFNNKGVYTGRFDAANLTLIGGAVRGEMRAVVLKSGAVSEGLYVFQLDGRMVGHVLCGRFHSTHEGKHVRDGYFVGGVQPLPAEPDDARP